MAKPISKTGTYTGTGAALNIELGFIPGYFHAINVTDGDASYSWFDGMAAGTCINDSGVKVTIASQGVTRNPGSSTVKAGVSLGTNAVINESGKVYRYVATRDDD